MMSGGSHHRKAILDERQAAQLPFFICNRHWYANPANPTTSAGKNYGAPTLSSFGKTIPTLLLDVFLTNKKKIIIHNETKIHKSASTDPLPDDLELSL